MSEAYRRALADGDMIAAGRAIMDAVSGPYNSDNVHGLHEVARMSRDERNAPAPSLEEDVAPNETVRVTTRIFGRRR